MPVIETVDVQKKYNDHKVLHGVNLIVEEKEVYGLLGPNGAGKSTFLNIIVNLITDYEGSIKIFGEEISQENLSNIGFVPQELSIYEDLSALQNVKFFGSLYKLRDELLDERCKEALEMVGLWEHRKKKPITFSGGMKRRLNIACSIVHNPKLIILDEPTVGIDPQSRNYILDSIKTLNKNGATIIYTSHYMEEVEAICSKVAIINAGQIVENGTIAEIKEKYLSSDCYECVLESGKSIFDVFPSYIISDAFALSMDRVIIILNRDYNVVNDIVIMATDPSSIVSIGKFRPTLEEIFLAITGKALRDGDN